MSKFTGLSAFPLTPIVHDKIDETAFIGLIHRLRDSGVDSITVLGSTGSYAYLTPGERARVARLAVDNAGNTPVFVGVGAMRTSQVLAHIDDAQEAGAQGILLAPMTYQSLTDDDVFELFRTVTDHTDLPVIVYDNPGTTHFSFTTEFYARIAALPGIASIKIPGVPTDPDEARAHVDSIKAVLPRPRDNRSIRGSIGGNRPERWMRCLVLGHRGHPSRTGIGHRPRGPGRRPRYRGSGLPTTGTTVGPVSGARRQLPGGGRHRGTPRLDADSFTAAADSGSRRLSACPCGAGDR